MTVSKPELASCRVSCVSSVQVRHANEGPLRFFHTEIREDMTDAFKLLKCPNVADDVQLRFMRTGIPVRGRGHLWESDFSTENTL